MKKPKLLSLFLAAVMLSDMSTISYANTAVSIGVLDEAADSTIMENTEIALNHSDVTDTSMTVSWNAVANAGSYTVVCNESIIAEGIIDNMYNITNLQSGSEIFVSVNAYDVSGVLLSSSEETVFHTSLTVNSNVTLTQDLTVENLYINDATLDLNGHSVIVENDTVMTGYSSKIIVGSGDLHINRDLRFENISNENIYVYGLEMTDPKGSVYVQRNIELLSRTGGTLSAGKIELCGNINNIDLNGFYNSFNTTGSHRLILSGRDTQTITLPQNSKLNIVEVKNFSEGGVFFVNRVSIADLKDNGCKVVIASEEDRIGWTLNEDETIDGNLYLAAGMLDLNGHKLTVTGDILQSGGTVFINGGELDVSGDYKLQPSDNVNNGILNMTNSADIVRITGDFVMQSIQSHNGKLSAGIMEISGDVIQVGGYNDNFHTTGEHTIILNGTSMQTVKFSSAGKNYSRINNLRIENTSDEGVVFSTAAYVVGDLCNTDSVIFNSANINITSETNLVNNLWNYDITVSESSTINDVVIGGNLYISSRYSIKLGSDVGIKQSLYIDGDIDLNGYELNVDGDVWLDSQLLMNRGTLNIGKDFNVVNRNNSDKSSGYITMKYNEDHISVSGDMMFCSGNNYSEFTAGTIEIKGNFTQKYSAKANNFYASGNHCVILNGNSVQKISFRSKESKFNILEIQNTSEEGVVFLSEFSANKVITNDCNIQYYDPNNDEGILKTDKSIDGDLLLDDGTLDLNGHTLTVTGNLIQSGGTINVNGGTLIVMGDYLIQTVGEKKPASSTGKLLMTNKSDVVTVAGDFVMYSDISHENCLTNGVLEVGGDFSQMRGSSYNFLTSGDHTIIFNGASHQTINFDNGTASAITNLKISNSSDDGVTFKRAIRVKGKIYNTESVVNNGENIYAGSGTVFENDLWNYNISFSTRTTLSDNLKIKGDVYIRNEVSLPSDSRYTISEDIFSKDVPQNYTLSVEGNIYMAGGTLRINGGSLFVGNCLHFGDLESGKSGGIIMSNDNDYVLVNGNVYHYSSGNN